MVLNFSYYIPTVGSALLLTFNQRLSAFNRFILNNSNAHRKRERAKTERYRHEHLIFILILNETVSFFSLCDYQYKKSFDGIVTIEGKWWTDEVNQQRSCFCIEIAINSKRNYARLNSKWPWLHWSVSSVKIPATPHARESSTMRTSYSLWKHSKSNWIQK